MERVMFILYTTYIVKSEAIAPEERKNYVQCSQSLSSKSQNITILHITFTGCKSKGRSSRLE